MEKLKGLKLDWLQKNTTKKKDGTIMRLALLYSIQMVGMYQMDAYNSFLQGDLYQVYMELPKGFMRQDRGRPKLGKSLYGLKQASSQ